MMPISTSRRALTTLASWALLAGVGLTATAESVRAQTDGVPERVATAARADRIRFERPEHVRGVYVNAWTAGSPGRLAPLLDLARTTEINTFVIDIKDATGHVSHDSRVPLARQVGATAERRIHDLESLLETLRDEGVYPIARIVIVRDPILTAGRPDMAIQDTAGGVWRDRRGEAWLNPYDPEVLQYHLDLAKEVAAAGFPEIQWDYVRFPDSPLSDLERATYPHRDQRYKKQVIRDFLRWSRAELDAMDVDVTADVFGATTSAGDIGIGQVWELFIPEVDAALPMIYPSHYGRGTWGIDRPNAYPYEIVRRALGFAVRRSSRVEGAGLTRPWLQDFSMGKPDYGAPEVRAQIQAAADAGVHEWIMWNPSSRYTTEAFEPNGGWRQEPMIRIADQLAPVSRRQEVLDSVADAKKRAADMRERAARAAVAADTIKGGGAR